MKIRYLTSLAMAALLVTACSQEEELAPQFTEGVLQASVESNRPGSRAGFEEESGTFYWSFKDAIGVTTSNNKTQFTKLDLASGGGTGSGTFQGKAKEGTTVEGYAVYPYHDNHAMDVTNNKLKYYFPDSYTYTQVDEGFTTSEKGKGNSFRPALLGEINTQSGTVQMKHLGAVFCIKFGEIPDGAKKLTLTANKSITGLFEVALSGTDAPKITTSTTQESTVTIDFSSVTLTNNQSGVFYVPVPTGEYSVRVKLLGNSDHELANVPAGTYQIAAADLIIISLVDGGITGTGPATQKKTMGEAQTELVTTENVAVTNEIQSSGNNNDTNKITIPAVTPVDNGETSRSLTLESVGSGAVIEVNSEASGSDGSSNNKEPVNNFTLSIPNDETTSFDALDVTINMPQTTVTLAGNGGTAKYGTVTATTSENTLVISRGVTVEKVSVKKGNIRVNSGAILSAIEKDSSLASVTIYKEANATIPSGLGSDFVVVDAAAHDLQKAASAGKTYVLNQDIVLSSPVVVEKDMTLNLNGHTISPKEGGLNKILNTSDAMILVRRDATLTIEDNAENKGCIDGFSSVICAVKLTDKADSVSTGHAKVIVNGGQLKGKNYGIVGNGTRHGTEITINGGCVEGGATGVYHPQDGTMTVIAGEIKGVDSAVELRSGTLTVEGGKFVTTRTSFSEAPNGSGTTMQGVALAVSQHSTDKAIKVTISGGEFIGEYALREKDLQNNTARGDINLSVTGGKFTGMVYSEDCPAFVSGGTFSDPNVWTYLAQKTDQSTAITLTNPIVVEQGTGSVEIDLKGNTLTSTGTDDKEKKTAIAVKDGATVTIKNGQIGTSQSDDKLVYGIYAYGTANVTLSSVTFSEMVLYAYNGAGTLKADNCKFQGWISGWSKGEGGTFTNCTFTKGKAYYPATICYGNTTFNQCKFYRNNVNPDNYEKTAGVKSWNPQDTASGGYFNCNSVVSAKKDVKVVMTSCTFFNEDESTTTGEVTTTAHPYLVGWGDAGTWAERLTVGTTEVDLSTNPDTNGSGETSNN